MECLCSRACQVILTAVALSVLVKKPDNPEEEEMRRDEEELVLQHDEAWLHEQRDMGEGETRKGTGVNREVGTEIKRE